MEEKMNIIERAVRAYIKKGIGRFEIGMPKNESYTIHCKWYSYIRGVYAAFVITDDPYDNSIYEVTFDPYEDENCDEVTMNMVHVRRYMALSDEEFRISSW